MLARRQVEALVTAGARRALADIELALARMRTGHYGYCRICGTGIPLMVLEAIPKTTLCLACQRFSEHAEEPPSPANSIPPSSAEPPREAPRRQRSPRHGAVPPSRGVEQRSAAH